MTPAEILQQFSETTERQFFPAQAVSAAKAQWPEVWPLIEQLMAQFIAKTEMSDAEYQQLFFGIMLIADRPFLAAAGQIFQLCDDDDDYAADLGYMLGDVVTEHMPTVFYVLAEGDPLPLIQLLQSGKSGMYIKAAALEALFAQLEKLQADVAVAVADDIAELTAALEQHRASVIAAIPTMIKSMVLQQQDYVLSKLAYVCITFGLDQFKHAFEVLLRQNELDTDVITSRSVNRWELSKMSTPLASGRVQPTFDITILNNFSAFRSPELEAEQTKMIQALFQQPQYLTNVVSKPLAGRNDPCPCGSGKKYKKCCLN